MRRAAIIGWALLAAPAAQACAIQQQSCTLADGREAYLEAENGSVVAFRTNEDAMDRMVVTECSSRASLAISQSHTGDSQAFWDTQAMLIDAIHDDAPQTLRALARQARRIGVEAELFTLPAGHCGCDLPNIPRPPSNCPADS